MHLHAAVAALAAALLLAPAARAADITVPPGFVIESVPGPGPLVAVLADGSVLLSTGTFGADQLDRVLAGGVVIPFATGFGSLAGVAQSPVTGDIVVGDSFGTTLLWLLADLNGDLDCLDAGETTPHPVQPPVLSNGSQAFPFDLAFKPGTDELYVSGSTAFGVEPLLGVVTRTAGGAVTVFAEGLGLAGGLAFAGDALYVADLDGTTFAGRVLALADGNGDDDALDAGESVVFAAGLSGASDLVVAADGSLYLSGLFDTAGDFSGCVGRLLPDDDGDGLSDQVDEVVIDGFPFTSTLTLLEGPAGFVPGAAGDGALIVGDFSYAGSRVVSSAPRAVTTVTGTVAANAVFQVGVEADPGALAFFVASLDPVGVTVAGVGDLCLGFSAPHLISGAQLVGPSGTVSWTIVFHGATALVGLPLEFQGVASEAGRLGLGNGLSFVVAP